MWFREAAEFFHRHGNVGRDVDDLYKGLPSESQLAAACNVAIARGQDAAIVDEARRAILLTASGVKLLRSTGREVRIEPDAFSQRGE